MDAENKNEVVKSDILPGGIGNITIGSTGEQREITAIKTDNKTGTVTLTIGANKSRMIEQPITEDVECEVVKPKEIPPCTGFGE